MNRRIRDLLILFGLALVWNTLIAARIDHPGYVDAYYYYNGGLSLARGDEWREPYLWNYVGAPPALPAPAFSYWRPLASIVAAGGILTLPWPSPFDSAQGAFVVLAAILPLVSYLVAEKALGERWFAWIAGLMTMLGGFYAPYWSLPETFTLFALTGALALVCVGLAREHGGLAWWAGAGIFAALADLTRADGVLLLGVAALFALTGQRRWRALGLLVLAYTLTMTPWFARNLTLYGSLQPPSGLSTLWLIDYNDLFNYPPDLTPMRFLQAGLRPILAARWQALWGNLATLVGVQHLVFLAPFSVIGFRQHRKSPLIAPALVYGLALFAAMTLAFPLPGMRGGLLHSGATLLPFIFTASLGGLRWVVTRVPRWRPRQAMRVFGAACIVYTALVTGYVLMRRLPTWNASDAIYAQIGAELDILDPGHEALVMSNNPPGMYYFTGRGGVPLPNGDEAMLLHAARDYNVRYLVVDANVPNGLISLYTDGPQSSDLRSLTTFGDVTLYQITPP